MENQQSYKLGLASSHHIQSFNYIYNEGLQKLLHYLQPMELHEQDLEPEMNKVAMKLPFSFIKLSFSHLEIGKPFRSNDPKALVQEIFPQECRLAGKTYTAPLRCEITREIDGAIDTFPVSLGEIPIMVKSHHCHLSSMDSQELIAVNEDEN
jgi:DNA-directed RNA polymerase I subunit RPA2